MGYKVISTEMSTKELLDNATAELMAEKGEGFTVREICKRAGVSIGTFYTYYKSKDEISLARLQYMDQYLYAQYQQLTSGSYEQRLKDFLLLYMAHAIRRGLTFSKEMYRCILMAEVSPEAARTRVFYQIIFELLEGGQKAGEFTAAQSAGALTDATISLARGLVVNWCHQGGTYDLSAAAEKAFSIWISGLKRQET